MQAKYAILLQIADQELRQRELILKEETTKVDKWANPLTVGVLVAALGLVGNFINGLWTNLNQQAQLENLKATENIKLQNDLIKEAIKPASPDERARSLVFFAKNHLIKLDDDVLVSLTEIAGSDKPVPGSSNQNLSSSSSSQYDLPIEYSAEMVKRILEKPGDLLPSNSTVFKKIHGHNIHAIILYTTMLSDNVSDVVQELLRNESQGLPRPLAQWLVKSDGSIDFTVAETQKANHVGKAINNLKNSNTIGESASGIPAFSNETQIENLVRLVADIADRWKIPTEMIHSHAEVAHGRKFDMLQQAPAIRRMVDEVRRWRDSKELTKK